MVGTMWTRIAAVTGASVAGLVLWYVCVRKKRGKELAAPFLTGGIDKPKQMVLERVVQISPDTKRFVFGLAHAQQALGLPIGHHIVLLAPNQTNEDGTWNGRKDLDTLGGKVQSTIRRKYTPVSRVTDKGKLELLVKIYEPNDQFADGGKMSQHLNRMKLQETIDVTGPSGRITYLGNGQIMFSRTKHTITKIGMIAGGTGITPMLQLMQAISDNKADQTKVSLLFGNQTPADILCKDELEEFRSRFDLWYTCLLYTSDAADEEDSVDLGGRRIIKKKKK
eukprot:TRINITY_DN4586_c0_g1_i11.p1 TRINITY_DN4586_c0_g1~~TRINITY_DN4586_c0_g1_i11.p1  ORF type:complete len:280 (+),score=83.18 TRINITY_DN4586_c0_g1_i11:226-1065(+)